MILFYFSSLFLLYFLLTSLCPLLLRQGRILHSLLLYSFPLSLPFHLLAAHIFLLPSHLPAFLFFNPFFFSSSFQIFFFCVSYVCSLIKYNTDCHLLSRLYGCTERKYLMENQDVEYYSLPGKWMLIHSRTCY